MSNFINPLSFVPASYFSKKAASSSNSDASTVNLPDKVQSLLKSAKPGANTVKVNQPISAVSEIFGGGYKKTTPLENALQASSNLLQTNIYSKLRNSAYEHYNLANNHKTGAESRVQSVLSDYHKQLNSGIKANEQKTADVIKANSFQADGITPLIV